MTMDSCRKRVLSFVTATTAVVYPIFLFMTILPQSQATGTPHIKNRPDQFVFHVGHTVLLPCLVEGDPPPMVEWYKDQVPVQPTWDRFRTTHRGLRIKDVDLLDSGSYVCRAVNGYGSAQISLSLVVTDELFEPFSEQPETNLYPEDPHDPQEKPSSGTKPVLKKMTGLSQGLVQRPKGSSISLRCVADGDPLPQLHWLKGEKKLPSDVGSSSSPTSPHRGKLSLTLHNLMIEDSGIYTCLATNALGSTNATFMLEVIERLSTKPELTGLHPLNTTVELGGIASFQCRVRSDVTPHIQWLKLDNINGTLQVRGEKYRVLRSNEVVVSQTEGIYLNKLVISPTTIDDSGKYICLGTNSMGYNFRSAYLKVVHSPKRHPVDGVSPEGLDRFPTTVTVVVPVALAILFVTFSFIYLKRRRRKRTPPHHPHGSTCVPMQRPQAVTFGADDRSRGFTEKACFPIVHPPLPPPPVSERSSSQSSDGGHLRSHSGLGFTRTYPQGHRLLYNC